MNAVYAALDKAYKKLSEEDKKKDDDAHNNFMTTCGYVNYDYYYSD